MDDDDEKRSRIKRLQDQARAQWSQPRTIDLDGPGPFELPMCERLSLVGRGSDPQVVLLLETTKKSQTVRIPIATGDIVGLKRWLTCFMPNTLLQ